MSAANHLRCPSPPERIVMMDLVGPWNPIAHARHQARTTYYRYTGGYETPSCFLACTNGLRESHVRGRIVVVTIEQDVGGMVVTILRLSSATSAMKLSRALAMHAAQ